MQQMNEYVSRIPADRPIAIPRREGREEARLPTVVETYVLKVLMEHMILSERNWQRARTTAPSVHHHGGPLPAVQRAMWMEEVTGRCFYHATHEVWLTMSDVPSQRLHPRTRWTQTVIALIKAQMTHIMLKAITDSPLLSSFLRAHCGHGPSIEAST